MDRQALREGSQAEVMGHFHNQGALKPASNPGEARPTGTAGLLSQPIEGTAFSTPWS